MIRFPEPELLDFLATHYSGSDKSLATIEREAQAMAAPSRHGLLSRIWEAIARAKQPDPRLTKVLELLHKAVSSGKGHLRSKDIARPFVMCIFGHGQDGKSSFAYQFQKQGVRVISTDHFINNLPIGSRLKIRADYYGPQIINGFIKEVENDPSLRAEFVAEFFRSEHGFKPENPLTVIEGFLHERGSHAGPRHALPRPLEEAIVKELEKRGYRVWVCEKP